jgi:UDP-N-acetylmuramyl pentapeptide phosphotransferase/UDP-N-acetylglucosamine-1-phosphate transferase
MLLSKQPPWGAFFVLSMLMACLSLAIFLRTPLRNLLLDRPNSRSLHNRPVPRIGGLGILFALSASVIVRGTTLPWPIWCALMMVVGVSLLDDQRSVSAALRLPVHLAAGALVAWVTLPQASILWVVVLTVALAWLINLYNFMDGSDGLAGTQSVVGFGAMALVAHWGGDPSLACTCAALAGGALGFLVFNWPPARVFMGDAGSTALGTLAGAIGAWGVHRGLWLPSFPVLAFFPFIFDASLTLADRVWRRQPIWQAHRDHAYQRLILSGWGHRNTLLVYSLWMMACAGVALTGASSKLQPLVYLFVLIASTVLYGIFRVLPRLQRSNRG